MGRIATVARGRLSLRHAVGGLERFAGQRVTVMGLGRHGGGLGAVRYLASHGAEVTISDSAGMESLVDSLAALGDLPQVIVRLGKHDPGDFRTDLVVVNPAVRADHPCLQIARAAGAVVTSEIELFLSACPAHVIGVTGSNGKSTTATMLADMLRAAGRRTWLGGNIGGSLLGDAANMTADDWVVLELSSFQLTHLSERAPLPEIAVVTNCSPNHLDWHGTWAEYVRAKQRLLAVGSRDKSDVRRAIAVLNVRDAMVREWAQATPREVCWSWPIERFREVGAPGEHNRINAACAAAAAEVAGVDNVAIHRALRDFQALPHRVELVAEIAGRRFYDDSKSTTPAATIAALKALRGPVWLLAGGHFKGGDLDRLAAAIAARACGVALFGAAREEIARRVYEHDSQCEVHCTEHLSDALAWCDRRSAPGDAILLSPACASFDQFRDYIERARVFRRSVAALRG